MKPFLVTFGMLFLLVLSTQFLRHIYVRWVEPKTSALDEYKEKTEKDIAASMTVEELLSLYDDAHP